MKFKDKIAVVTGAASPMGIGFATASELGRQGASVIVTDIDWERINSRAADLRSAGVTAIAIRHDVSSFESWAEVFELAVTEFGGVDILVNNAGVAILEPLDRLTVEDFERLCAVNLKGTFIGCKLGVEAIARRQSGGVIVNVSSVAGIVGVAGTTGYGATKGGIRLLTKSVALEAAKQRIRCNSVHPGAILTEIQVEAQKANPDLFAGIEAHIPLGRLAEPHEVASAISFLCSEDAEYITGTELVIDGGLTAQ